MNQQEMRAQFREHVSDLGAELSDAEVNTRLNFAYRWIVPMDVDGDVTEGLWSKTVTPGTCIYDFDDYVIALNKPHAWINNPNETNYIGIHVTDRLQAFLFRWNYDASDLSVYTGRPVDVLIYNRQMWLSHNPDQNYTISFECRVGPKQDLSSDGLSDSVHAQTVVHAATWKFGNEIEDDTLIQREGSLYNSFKDLLNTRAKSRFRTRPRKRSF